MTWFYFVLVETVSTLVKFVLPNQMAWKLPCVRRAAEFYHGINIMPSIDYRSLAGEDEQIKTLRLAWENGDKSILQRKQLR
jgi:hypothetical protein